MTQAANYSVPLVGPSTPTNFAQRIDDTFDAIISGHSGSARPTYAVAGMIWEDTSVANETRLWFYDGSQDILVAVIDTANDRVELAPQPLVDVASAATTDIGAVKSRNIRVTGTTTITSFGTIRAGTTKTVYFSAALTVTYNATSLITPTGASLAVAAGDSLDLVSLGSGNWRVLRHTAALPVGIALGTVASPTTAAVDFTGIPANAKRVNLMFSGLSTNGTSAIAVVFGTSGGFETSGYRGTYQNYNASAIGAGNLGNSVVLLAGNSAASLMDGSLTLSRTGSGNTWTFKGDIGQEAVVNGGFVQGAKTMGGVLDRIRLTTANGTDLFDAGVVNISYEV